MKKLFISLLSIVAISVSAQENWVIVEDSTDGQTRLIVNSESFTANKDKTVKDSPIQIGAMFRTFNDGVLSEFVMITNVESCKNNGGEITVRKLDEGKWKTTGKFFWVTTGKRLYDSAGQALCIILEVRLDEQRGKKATPTI
jgi:hypothetical protein